MDSPVRSRLVQGYLWAIVLCAGVGWAWSAGVDASLPTPVAASLAGAAAFTILGLVLQLTEHRLTVSPARGSVAFIVYLGSALVFGRTWGAAITGVSLGVAQLLARKRPLRIAFNVWQHVLAVLLASALYETLGGESPPQALESSIFPFAGMVVAKGKIELSS